MYSQSEIVYLTPEKLYEDIRNSGKYSVIQFWVPSCKNNVEIVTNYKLLVDKYGAEINFYFIGITNKESLVTDLITQTGYNSKLYIIDKSILPNDLFNRKKVFNEKFTQYLSSKKKDFITGYIKSNFSEVTLNNKINVNESKIERVFTKIKQNGSR